MDTYASSATDSGGFYDIAALGPAGRCLLRHGVQPEFLGQRLGLFASHQWAVLDQTTVNEYASVVPPSKVILGLPYFGIDWPTTNGTLLATAPGPATDVALGQILTSRASRLLGPRDRDWLDLVPGREPVARDVLRRPDFAL